MRHTTRAGLALGAILALAAWSVTSAQEAPELTVSDQEVESGSDTITIDSFTLTEPGYVVVHEGTESNFGDVIGNSEYLEAGDYTDFEVTLDRELEDGEYVWPMLHSEASGNEQYDSVQDDPPVSDQQAGNADVNNVVAFPMQITVQDGTATPTGTPTASPTGTATASPTVSPTGTVGAQQGTPTGTPGPAGAGNAGLAGGGAVPLGLAALFIAATVGATLIARRVTAR